MWILLVVILLSIFLLLYIFRRILSQENAKQISSYPQLYTFNLLVSYLPLFLLKGLVPVILMARKRYGPTFVVHIWGMKRRIFFITDPIGRNAISKNPHLRLPAAQVAQVFGVGKEILEALAENDFQHAFGAVFQGTDLKNLTSTHSTNLQKTIRECLNHSQKRTESGLFELCQTLVYESITNTLYGSSIDARSIVKEMKVFDMSVHLLAYPRPYRWFRPDLIWSKKQIDERLSTTDNDIEEPKNPFLTKMNEVIGMCEKEDVGRIKTTILWASFGNVIPAVFWTYYYLCCYPELFEVIHREIADNSAELVEGDLVHALPYLDSAIEETMRLTANALVLRECAQDTHVVVASTDRKISLMKNDIIILFPFASQIDEQLFPYPREFIYDRFVVGSSNEASPAARRAHAPFGEGKFICPGRYFGKNIVKLTIVALFKQFNIQFLDQCDRMKIPAMQKSRHGFGIPPPAKDVRVQYRVKG